MNNPDDYNPDNLVHKLLVNGMIQRIEKYGQTSVLEKINHLKMKKMTLDGYRRLFFEAVRDLEGLPKDKEE